MASSAVRVVVVGIPIVMLLTSPMLPIVRTLLGMVIAEAVVVVARAITVIMPPEIQPDANVAATVTAVAVVMVVIVGAGGGCSQSENRQRDESYARLKIGFHGVSFPDPVRDRSYSTGTQTCPRRDIRCARPAWYGAKTPCLAGTYFLPVSSAPEIETR